MVASTILIIIGSMYAVILKRKLAETVILAFVSVVFVLYCFSLINTQGSLLYGLYFIIAFTVYGLVFLVYKQYKKKDTFREIEAIRGCLLYMGLLAFSFVMNYGRTFFHWDEFTLWGTIVKHFFYNDALGTVANPNYKLYMTTFLPGTSLFQYFYVRFSHQFYEHTLYIAMNMMYFCLVMPLVKDVFSKGKWFMQSVLLAILIVLPAMLSGGFYFTTYVDAILGVFFGFSLLYYYVYKYEDSLFGVLIVSATVFMLVLTKEMGLVLSIAVLGIILADIILFKREQVKHFLTDGIGISNKIIKLFLLLLPLLCVPFIRLSWANLVSRSGNTQLASAIAPDRISALFADNLEQYQIETMETFKRAMTDLRFPSFFNLSVVSFGIAYIIVSLILLYLLRKNMSVTRMMTTFLLITFGLYAYQFTLALSYILVFSDFEAVRLASYDRYTATYLLGMMFVLVVFLSIEQKHKLINSIELEMNTNAERSIRLIIHLRNWREKAIAVIVSVGLLLSLIVITPFGIRAVPRILARMQYIGVLDERPITAKVGKWIPYFINERPLLIDQGSTGLSMWEIRYELIPYAGLANVWGDWSISTEPYYDDDPWTMIVTPEEWEQFVLSNDISLIYVLNADEVLQDTYGRFFIGGAQSDMVYRVQSDNGAMTLHPVVE